MSKKAKKNAAEVKAAPTPEMMFLVRRDVLEAAIQYLAARPFNEVANLVTALGQSQPAAAPAAKSSSEGQE